MVSRQSFVECLRWKISKTQGCLRVIIEVWFRHRRNSLCMQGFLATVNLLDLARVRAQHDNKAKWRYTREKQYWESIWHSIIGDSHIDSKLKFGFGPLFQHKRLACWIRYVNTIFVDLRGHLTNKDLADEHIHNECHCHYLSSIAYPTHGGNIINPEMNFLLGPASSIGLYMRDVFLELSGYRIYPTICINFVV